MLAKEGFDNWAQSYDEGISEAGDEYPFGGYYDVLTCVHSLIDCPEEKKILDIGVGTGLLSYLLYKRGSRICGIDFSEKMLERARRKVPKACFYCHDFSKGLPVEVTENRFDYVVSSYAFHHLKNQEKIELLNLIRPILKDNGKIIIADISFTNRQQLEACRAQYKDQWDHQEEYVVAETFMKDLEAMGWKCQYQQISHCGGVLTIEAPRCSLELS